MKNKYAQRRDDNEKAIVDALRESGCYVSKESPLDLIVGSPDGMRWVILEIKDDGKASSKRKLTRDEKIFLLDVKGQAKGARFVVENVREAMVAVGLPVEP